MTQRCYSCGRESPLSWTRPLEHFAGCEVGETAKREVSEAFREAFGIPPHGTRGSEGANDGQ